MKKHFLPVQKIDRRIFDNIASGRKKIETRAGGPKYAYITAGDTLEIRCGSDSITKRVSAVHSFRTITDMLKRYSVTDIDPDLISPEELERMYLSFPGYRDRITQYGILAFELE